MYIIKCLCGGAYGSSLLAWGTENLGTRGTTRSQVPNTKSPNTESRAPDYVYCVYSLLKIVIIIIGGQYTDYLNNLPLINDNTGLWDACFIVLPSSILFLLTVRSLHSVSATGAVCT